MRLLRSTRLTRTARTAFLALALGACATTEPRPAPLTGADIVERVRAGQPAAEIVAELQRTRTVLPLQASDFVALHDQGVPPEVLDYLQRAQIDEIRWRDRNSAYYWYGPMNRGFGPCPWPYTGFRRPYAGGPWGC